MEFLRAARTPFSFVLVDYLMPQKTGLDLLRALRRRGLATPAALMTASFSYELRDRAFALGACHVFAKPISEDELVHVIRRFRTEDPA